ncbi:Putative ribonuclease H protein At1g65750 [Linum perenne]
MDQVLVNFWWSGDTSSKKIHWLAATELRQPIADGGLGFRNFYDFNLAFIAKLAWKNLIQLGCLWVQLLKGIYYPNSDFLQANKHHRSSWIWSGIMEGRKALLHGLRKNIGDGYGTNIIDVWIPEAAGFKASCSLSHSTIKVSDYIINPQRIWNAVKLRSVFPESVVRQILLIPLGLEGYADRLIWHYESTGNFIVRSCYRHLRAITNSHNHPVDNSTKKMWKWLWQLDLPPKIKFFLWRVCRNALPTKIGLFRRRCSTSSLCHTCNGDDETLEHMLFHCPVSMSFWQQVLPTLQGPSMIQSAQSWFKSLASTVSQSTATQIGYTLWYIWKMRNEFLFQNISPQLPDLISKRANELQQWNLNTNVRGTVSSLSSSANSFHLTNSLPPTTYSFKVVCDGAFKASIQKGAYGVIVYNAEGHVVNGKAGNVMCAAPVCAEAYAVLSAVDLVKNIAAPTLIHTDSSIIVDSITRPQQDWPWNIAGLLASITRLLYWNQQIHISKSTRSTVQQAHCIAVQARDDLLPLDWLCSL